MSDNAPLTPFEEPNHKTVVSLRTVRLASTEGHTAIVEAQVPTEIHRSLFQEASMKGCVDWSPEMAQLFANAAAAMSGESKPENPVDLDPHRVMMDAVRQVKIASESNAELATAQGVPKVGPVRAAVENVLKELGAAIDAVQVTRKLIDGCYAEIVAEQGVHPEPTMLDTTEARYPVGEDYVADGMDDGEVGDIDEALENYRLNPVDMED